MCRRTPPARNRWRNSSSNSPPDGRLTEVPQGKPGKKKRQPDLVKENQTRSHSSNPSASDFLSHWLDDSFSPPLALNSLVTRHLSQVPSSFPTPRSRAQDRARPRTDRD